MKIENIFEGIFVERPNRFLVHFKLNSADKTVEMAHLRDPGRLTELLTPNIKLLLRKATNPNRKTGYDVIAVHNNNRWILINSGFHSDLASELIKSGLIRDINDYSIDRREFSYGNSRIDFLLKAATSIPMLLEVKGCTLVEEGLAKFPDAPTLRGKKHLDELSKSTKNGYEAAVLFLIIRDDAEEFTPNTPMDPDFAASLKNADENRVKIIAYSFQNIYKNNILEIRPFKRVPIVLDN
ncbi:Sugar fermentation stimulation protein A [Methanobacterium lacus]|uniref:Sugar fermentation stimulation protein homolog n=1 Tax=Methanobacterium lacus (strain AL-21) TaxID=877455 RepID=F0T6Q6_METLA|nr:DNA/RNA nuclease SfsA [Methanobacterium lacus]ADZ08289.1 Sugar fermentation stimulation protein A [Methanobacterium lacus]